MACCHVEHRLKVRGSGGYRHKVIYFRIVEIIMCIHSRFQVVELYYGKTSSKCYQSRLLRDYSTSSIITYLLFKFKRKRKMHSLSINSHHLIVEIIVYKVFSLACSSNRVVVWWLIVCVLGKIDPQHLDFGEQI